MTWLLWTRYLVLAALLGAALLLAWSAAAVRD
jgi:hypothetical protein